MWSFSRLIVVVAVLCPVCLADAQDQMPWQPNLETAQQIAGQTNRLVLVHFWAPWCKPCVQLDKDVFSRPETAQALGANFVFVKLNFDEAPGTARLFGVSSLPTDVIISPSGRLVSQFQSPPTQAQYIAQVNQAAAGHRELARQAAMQAAAAAQVPAVAPPIGQAPYGAASPNIAPPSLAANVPAESPVTQQAYSNEQYAEYLRQHPTGQMSPPVGPPANSAAAPAQQAAAPNNANQAYTARASYQPQLQLPQLPPGAPPVGFDGHCPVTLVERQQWSMGDARWGAVHRGRTYLFLGAEEQKKFLANPDRYSPVLSGNDPVMALDNHVIVAGRREFGIQKDQHIYLFADEASLQRFQQNPDRYATEVLRAMR